MKNKKKNAKSEVQNVQKSTAYVESTDTATAFGMTNAFGTYEVQRTADTDNDFPTIAQGLGKEKKKEK